MRSAMHQQASYLKGVPLMWMLPLFLHVNQKSDDDDEQHHWHMVKMLNHNALHNIAFLTSLQELVQDEQCIIIGSPDF